MSYYGDWLKYGVWQKPGRYLWDAPKSRNQYYTQAFLSGASRIASGYYNARDSVSYMDDYMNNRGISWDQVKYASLTPGWSGGSSAGASLRSVSRNVSSLYSSGSRYNEKYRSDMRRAYWDGRRSR